MKRIAVLTGALAIVMAVAPAAHAISIPFGTSYTLDGQAGYLPGQAQDTGMVGFCDPQLRCTGFRLIESTSNVNYQITPTTVTLRGVVCIGESSYPCSETGVPFTGVKITERVVDPSEPSVWFTASVSLCWWAMAPQDAPTGCNPAPPAINGWSTPDSGNLVEKMPDGFGLELSG